MPTYKYRTLADLQAFRGALEQISAHSLKMAAMADAVNATILSNPLAESSPGLGVAAIQVGLEELEGIGALYEKHAVHFLGEARKPGETVLEYAARIDSLDIRATQKRNKIMLMGAW